MVIMHCAHKNICSNDNLIMLDILTPPFSKERRKIQKIIMGLWQYCSIKYVFIVNEDAIKIIYEDGCNKAKIKAKPKHIRNA